MKNKSHPQSAALLKKQRHKRGFALIVTLILMILLTVIAVGLLALSSISLRTVSKDSDRATAQANARMALMLALGDLQKCAGLDQRVTARADVLDANITNPRITGVWKSWEIKATSPPFATEYEKSGRDQKFVGWLASCPDGIASKAIGFAGKATTTPVTLWGKGSLGNTAPAADVVTAGKVAIAPARGAFAWAVMDEGVKVRINTPYVNGAVTKGAQTAQLGSGERPNASSLTGMGGLQRNFFEKSANEFATVEKGVTPLNLGLATETLAPGTRVLLKPLTHDVTSSSVGLFTNTAIGGLKEDFNLLTNTAALPAQYAGRSVYQSRLATTGVSDPSWDSLHQFSRIYTDSTRLSASNGVPVLNAQGPTGWVAANGSNSTTGVAGTINRTPPAGVVLMPTVAKVQVVFSLLTRDIYNYPKVSDTTPKIPGSNAEENASTLHAPWGWYFAGSSYDYLLHLLYTPVVTLHNPYNVALEFTDLKVLFGNVPFALQVIRNGIPQTNAPAPLDTLYGGAGQTGTLSKRFGMTLKTNGGTPAVPSVGSTTFRLLPGEVMMFSPYIDPKETFQDVFSGSSSFSDTTSGSTRTLNIDGIPGWRGDGIGFDLDWFSPTYNGLRTASYEVENGVSMWRDGSIAAKASDEFSVKFAPLSIPGPGLSNNKFTVEIFAKPPGASSAVSSGLIEMDYETATGLQDTLLGPNGTITYPKTGTINTMAMHSHATTPIKEIVTAKPFALFSAQAKATLGGLTLDGEDGKLATKPWCFGHASSGALSGKVVSEHSANLSHEIALQRLDNGTINLLQYDYNSGRGNSITGQTGNTGLKFGVLYDIPLAPLQTLAGLNGANPGGSSGYLPRFAQPIGNSWAHPLLDTSKIITSAGSYQYLDHSFLLNLALYDHFYFSGIADQTGPFGNASVKATNLIDDFIAGKSLVDPRIALYAPDGKARTQLATDATAADAYARIASWQVMNGAFNINSTSVGAWKAMLGSIHDSQAVFNKINKTAKNSSFANLTATDSSKNEARISRFRLPTSESAKNGGDPKESYWLGAREYSDAELQLLAEKIVEQVRLRGPFLSMAEFVNRRLGTGETAQRGALQQAIDNANLNQNLATAASAGWEIPAASVATYKYQNAKAGTGSSFQGAPGYLSQSDLLNVLGNAATPRSDTFTIRSYGEARDASNNLTATATCEAVVQRVPEYIDPADKADTATTALTSTANKNFGRRFVIVSFRWLAPNEI